MVLRGVFREKSAAGGRDEGVADIGEDSGVRGSCGGNVWGRGRGRVEDEADAELVGGAFKAESYHSSKGYQPLGSKMKPCLRGDWT